MSIIKSLWWGRTVVPNIPHGMNNSCKVLQYSICKITEMRVQYVHVCYAYFVCNVSYIIILITSCIFQQFWLGGPADPYPYVGLIVKINEVFFWQKPQKVHNCTSTLMHGQCCFIILIHASTQEHDQSDVLLTEAMQHKSMSRTDCTITAFSSKGHIVTSGHLSYHIQ